MGIPAFWATPHSHIPSADSFDFAEIISDWGKVGIVNHEFTAE